MEKKSQDFSINEACRLAGTKEGQELMQLLRQTDSSRLEKAASLAATGDYAQAGALLQTLLTSDRAQALLRQLGGQNGGF